MREYETTFIVQPEISDEGCSELLGRLDGVLAGEGAARLLHDDQGKKRLAYEIRKFQKGRYITTFFLDEGQAVAPFERALRLDESVLRFLTVLRADKVDDVELRKAQAAEEERIRAERARERAEREAEEDKARQVAAAEAAEQAAKQAAEQAAKQAEEAANAPVAEESAPAAEGNAPAAEESAPAEAAESKAPESSESGAEAPAAEETES